ncbi:MAG TPA: phosphoenolpyruvate--protein phosphotransferase [Stellaceae bacterium]|jgi:phosphotransferase system enzyme I (PtsP)|nr:phosphoenolpyruvate--protein phosphotransferase [Stellaceae bacterium]
MTETVPSSRLVLRRLRDVMAGQGTAQERLTTIVRIIAADMVAEVCSCYIMRAGEVLELFATEGLRPEAVHRTRLRVGEGLVGVIAASARPLALADAQSHPDFAYRPETGEEIYHSLMGVPILRSGRVLGVLVVQNRTTRHYDEDEIEVLQTIAMVLAELVASGELVNPLERQQPAGIGQQALRMDGVKLNGGLALGQAVLHEPRLVIRQVVAENTHAELDRLRRAVDAMHGAIDALLEASDVASDGEHRDILETYRMFAADLGWLQRITDAIESGLTAEAAVQKVQGDMRLRMNQATDPYLRERLADLEDLTNRLQRHLAGRAANVAASELPEEFIVIARNMGPAEFLDYDRRRLKGLVLEEGSPNSHVAVVARALDIPVVGRVKDALARVESGDLVVINGDEGAIVLRPNEDVIQAVDNRIKVRLGQRQQYEALRDLPAESRDGTRVELLLNSGLFIDMPYLDETGAGGVGLFRTELQFMLRDTFPTVPQQASLYRRVLDQAGNRPVTFRTLDIGGDKVLPYMDDSADENPAMGWRAIRIALDRPAMLRQQLRALIRAAAGRSLRVMFPMIADIGEFDTAREIFSLELDRQRKAGETLPTTIALGLMLEVPALIWQLPALVGRADFISVGTNDLVQFLFAADRGNPRLAGRYDPLSPPVLRVLGDIAAGCATHRLPVAVCGEMAGDPLEAMVLVGLGYRALSMAPSAIGPVKAMIRSLEVPALIEFIASLSDVATHSLRGKFHDFARDRGIVVA